MSPEPDYYAVLGVTQDASPDEIRAAYRRAARASHPDLNPGDQTAPERFKRVQRAYDVLDHPARRAAYDHAAMFTPAAWAPFAAAGRQSRSAVSPEEPVSLARELGETVRMVRVMARRSGFSGRVRRLIRYLENL